MAKQTVICEGCGSKWTFVYVANQIAASLTECPLCTVEKLD